MEIVLNVAAAPMFVLFFIPDMERVLHTGVKVS